mmetsp:Transcript_43378/g.48275  ORF Transcript_43378/g.48275 Transcript_43378/m.48275 type:complete len:89 (+) Transcript_43378:654-920(+)
MLVLLPRTRRTTCNVYEKVENLIRRRRETTRDSLSQQVKNDDDVSLIFFRLVSSSRQQVHFCYITCHATRTRTSHHITSLLLLPLPHF